MFQIKLTKCVSCSCVEFDSPAPIPSCFNCGHSSDEHAHRNKSELTCSTVILHAEYTLSKYVVGSPEEEWTAKWIREGKTIEQTTTLFNAKFDMTIW